MKHLKTFRNGSLKRFSISILLLSCFNLFSIAQDTVTVQTFTFDSITTRRGVFQFPDQSNTYRKILMSYTLKCDEATTADQYPCGEWDYLTYTTVHHKTGQIDSTLYTHDRFQAGINSFTDFPINLSYPSYILQYQTDTILFIDSILNDSIHPIGTLFYQGMDTLQSSTEYGSTRFIHTIPGVYYSTYGLDSGQYISGIRIYFDSPGTILHNFKIRSADTICYSSEIHTVVWKDLFWGDLSIDTAGWYSIYFNRPEALLSFQPTESLTFDISYDLPETHAPVVSKFCSFPPISFPCYKSTGDDYCVHFSGDDWVELPAGELADSIQTEVTLAFWQYGDSDQPQNSTILNAVDAQNNRLLNIHLPWSNSNVYWDAGFQSGSYDRINAAANANDFKNRWNFWAFTKNTVTGIMKIYLNGELWLSGSGKTKPMAGIKSFYIGSATNKSSFYKGKMDELSIWNRELSESEILYLMNRNPGDPVFNSNQLLAYYSFNDSSPAQFAEYSNQCSPAINFGGTLREQIPSDELKMNLNIESNLELQLLTGNYQTHQEILTHTDTIPLSPVSIFEFEVINDAFVSVDTQWYYMGGNQNIIDESGTVIGQVALPADSIIVNNTIYYYGPKFEVVSNIEIGRFITPYGIGLSLGNAGFEWLYDVTDYEPILHDSVDISAGNNQELLDLKFYFIEGTPPRDVKNITEVWGSRNSYSYKDLDNNSRLSAKWIHLNPDAENFKLKTRITGHGHNSNDGNYPHCCEWKPNEHFLLLNADTIASWYVWQNEKCAMNPVYPQGGTWPGPREGWCPGDKVNDNEFELTSWIQSDSIQLDYDITDVPTDNLGMGSGNYVMSMQLIEYGAPNFLQDIELVDILNPSIEGYYSRSNPICRDISMIIRNNGMDTIHTAQIEYFVSGGAHQFYNWNGTLSPHESQVIAFAVPDFSFWNGDASQLFTAILSLPNVPAMEYPANNSMTVPFALPDVYNQNFIIVYRSNNLPGENWYEVRDMSGQAVFGRYTADPNTNYNDTLHLEEGCYTITLVDSGLDGLSYWAYPEQGNGLFRLKKIGGANLKVFETEFGHKITYSFILSGLIHATQEGKMPGVDIYPNPANDKISISVDDVDGTIQMELLDVAQRLVMQRQWINSAGHEEIVPVGNLPAGIYFVIISSGENRYTRKIIIN